LNDIFNAIKIKENDYNELTKKDKNFIITEELHQNLFGDNIIDGERDSVLLRKVQNINPSDLNVIIL
jgi:hypothetical protein